VRESKRFAADRKVTMEIERGKFFKRTSREGNQNSFSEFSRKRAKIKK